MINTRATNLQATIAPLKSITTTTLLSQNKLTSRPHEGGQRSTKSLQNLDQVNTNLTSQKLQGLYHKVSLPEKDKLKLESTSTESNNNKPPLVTFFPGGRNISD